ncbi:MAG: TIM barrel protein [Rhodobacteraceae bacterium]|nr:TIM barrel protein [Paracoccaceae bacterium]
MTHGFKLAACAEMLWLDKPIDWRASRLKEMGFDVGLWYWQPHDHDKLIRTGATFTIVNGYLRGRLSDDAGAEELIATARQTVHGCRRLGIQRFNLHGTGLNAQGLPDRPVEHVTGAMWLKAQDTLKRICELAEEEDVVFTLENLNLVTDHPGTPFALAEDTIALVSSIDHPRLRLNLDLYHAQLGEGNLIGLCKKAQPWIGEIQVADVPGRCEPGTGEVNFAGVARALAAMGYGGPVAMEAWAASDSDAALAAFRTAFTL